MAQQNTPLQQPDPRVVWPFCTPVTTTTLLTGHMGQILVFDWWVRKTSDYAGLCGQIRYRNRLDRTLSSLTPPATLPSSFPSFPPSLPPPYFIPSLLAMPPSQWLEGSANIRLCWILSIDSILRRVRQNSLLPRTPCLSPFSVPLSPSLPLPSHSGIPSLPLPLPVIGGFGKHRIMLDSVDTETGQLFWLFFSLIAKGKKFLSYHMGNVRNAKSLKLSRILVVHSLTYFWSFIYLFNFFLLYKWKPLK